MQMGSRIAKYRGKNRLCYPFCPAWLCFMLYNIIVKLGCPFSYVVSWLSRLLHTQMFARSNLARTIN